jgi:YggT family protein
MFIAKNFILAIAQLIDFLLTAYMWIVIGRAVVSWVSADPYNPVVRFLHEATEPVLGRVRRLLPISVGGVDFSPVVVILGIVFLQSFLVPTLKHLAM